MTPRNEYEALAAQQRPQLKSHGWRKGRHVYKPGKGHQLNFWRRMARAVVRAFI